MGKMCIYMLELLISEVSLFYQFFSGVYSGTEY